MLFLVKPTQFMLKHQTQKIQMWKQVNTGQTFLEDNEGMQLVVWYSFIIQLIYINNGSGLLVMRGPVWKKDQSKTRKYR